jgi:hypothetical protein
MHIDVTGKSWTDNTISFSSAWKGIKKFFSAVGDALSADFECGMGLGVSLTVCKFVDIELIGVISADHLHIARETESYRKAYAKANISVIGFGIGVEAFASVTRELLDKENKFWTNPYTEFGVDSTFGFHPYYVDDNQDLNVSIGGSVYFIFGIGGSINFNLSQFKRSMGWS